MISLVSLLRHLGKGAVYNLYNNMIKETKYCSVGMEKHFNKELVLTREDNEENFTNTWKNFEKSTKCWICDKDHVDSDVIVRYHCHITEK